MRKLIVLLLIPLSLQAFSQSKSVTKFRSDFKENSNLFFYSSTLKMLNTENNPDFAGILEDIEEIRVLNYQKSVQKFGKEDIAALKSELAKESYNNIMMMNEKGNSVNLYNREKKGRTTGMVAIIENAQDLILIDLIGSIDVKKFLELQKKIETRSAL
jgi:hypothetical protein